MIPESVFAAQLREQLAPVVLYLDDVEVSEIMINGPSQVFVERHGIIEATSARFASDASLNAALRVLAQYMGRPLDQEHPILEGRLPDGCRVEAVLSPIAKNGSHVAIRKFSKDKLSVESLIAHGALDFESTQFLRQAVLHKKNIVVSGGTGTGKTSLLNVLTAMIPQPERIVMIEDARELLPQSEHVVSLESRPPDEHGRGAVTIRDLFKATLRMRPDRIVVGEIRDGAALELIQAMTSGHGGCLSTVHASHPSDALRRLETMALMADVALPLKALRAQLVSAVDVIVQVDRLRTGARVVTQIAEVCGVDADGAPQMREVFVRTCVSAHSSGVLSRAPLRDQKARELHSHQKHALVPEETA